MKARTLFEAVVITLIGNGNNTQILLDKWHTKGILGRLYGKDIYQENGLDKYSMVSLLLDDGNWQPWEVHSDVLRPA